MQRHTADLRLGRGEPGFDRLIVRALEDTRWTQLSDRHAARTAQGRTWGLRSRDRWNRFRVCLSRTKCALQAFLMAEEGLEPPTRGYDSGPIWLY